MAFWQWSTTSSLNGTIDPTINMAEGMPPAQVNDGVRAIMARLAEYRTDQSGAVVTTGTNTAYAVSSNQGFSSLTALLGQKLKIIFHIDCGANATLNVDGQGAIPLVFAGYNTTPGSLRQFGIYDVTYDGVHFNVTGGTTPLNTPIGFVGDFAGFNAPPLWLLCDGQQVSTTTYASLFSVLGYYYGGGGSVFSVPDYRGLVIAGLDNMGGTNAGRIGTLVTDSGTINGSVLGSIGGSQSHVQTNAELVFHGHSGSGNVSDPGHAHVQTGGTVGSSGTGVPVNASGDQVINVNTAASATFVSVPSLNINGAGGSAAMALLQPTAMANKIIFAGV